MEIRSAPVWIWIRSKFKVHLLRSKIHPHNLHLTQWTAAAFHRWRREGISPVDIQFSNRRSVHTMSCSRIWAHPSQSNWWLQLSGRQLLIDTWYCDFGTQSILVMPARFDGSSPVQFWTWVTVVELVSNQLSQGTRVIVMPWRHYSEVFLPGVGVSWKFGTQ